ncbi:MAG: alanine--tRNA ligase-related protein [Acidimicrobiales bacterium]
MLSTVAREEEKFRQTLKTGSTLLDSELATLPPSGTLDGEVAFKLHDTYGFPLEVTQEFVELGGYELDVAGFESAMARQRAGSKAAAKSTGVATDAELGDFQAALKEHGQTTFVGREVDSSEATVLAVVGSSVILDRTPFYAESGGQVGDTGTIRSGDAELRVIDTTYALPGLVRHVISSDDAGLLASPRRRSGGLAPPPDATPSAGTTPPRTSSTGRCAPSSATT